MSDEEMLDIHALHEMREKEILLEIGKLKPEDPNRQKLFSELKILAEIRNADETTDLNRLNNQAKNELEETRLAIDTKKANNETARIWVDLGRIAAAVYTSIRTPFIAYHMEEYSNPYKKMEQSMTKLKDDLMGRFR